MRKLFHEQASAVDLGFLRFGVFATWLWLIASLRMANFSEIHPALLRPRGFVRLIPIEALFQQTWLMVIFQALTVVGCALCAYGIRGYPIIAPVTAGLILFFDGATKTIGSFVNHAQAAMLISAIILAFFPAHKAFKFTLSNLRDPSLHSSRSPGSSFPLFSLGMIPGLLGP